MFLLQVTLLNNIIHIQHYPYSNIDELQFEALTHKSVQEIKSPLESFKHVFASSNIDSHLRNLSSTTSNTTNILFQKSSSVLSSSFRGMQGFFNRSTSSSKESLEEHSTPAIIASAIQAGKASSKSDSSNHDTNEFDKSDKSEANPDIKVEDSGVETTEWVEGQSEPGTPERYEPGVWGVGDVSPELSENGELEKEHEKTNSVGKEIVNEEVKH